MDKFEADYIWYSIQNKNGFVDYRSDWINENDIREDHLYEFIKLVDGAIENLEGADRKIVGDGTKYCICTNCGKAVDPWDNFCKECGRRLYDRKGSMH